MEIYSKENYLNKSKINTFISCPRRYKYEFVDKIEPKKSNDMILGEVFHQATNLFYDYLKQHLDTNVEADIQLFEKIMIGIIGEENYRIQLFKNFVDFEYKRYKFYQYDLSFFFPILKETYFCDDELRLDGIIDRVFLDEKGYHLQEIKTGKIPYYTSSIDAVKRELAIYKLLLEKNDYNVTLCSVYYVRENKVIPYNITQKDISRAIKTIHSVRRQIEALEFPRRESLKCLTYCPFFDVCLKDKEKEKEITNKTVCGFKITEGENNEEKN